MFDYHIHTCFSDGRDSHEQMIEEAIAKGYSQMGFTDHYCCLPCDWAIHSKAQLIEMKQAFEEAKQKYASQIEILLGLEIDYFPHKEKEIQETIDFFKPDYVIGSVHFLGEEGFDSDPNHPIYKRYTADELYIQYFDILQKAIQFKPFDIIGHADLIKKYQTWPSKDFSETYEKVIHLILENNVLIELNTSGPDRPCKEFFPSPSFVQLMAQQGVKFTLGSDSHKTEHIARNFELGIELLEKCGVKQLYQIQKGEAPKPVPIGNFHTKVITQNN